MMRLIISVVASWMYAANANAVEIRTGEIDNARMEMFYIYYSGGPFVREPDTGDPFEDRRKYNAMLAEREEWRESRSWLVPLSEVTIVAQGLEWYLLPNYDFDNDRMFFCIDEDLMVGNIKVNVRLGNSHQGCGDTSIFVETFVWMNNAETAEALTNKALRSGREGKLTATVVSGGCETIRSSFFCWPVALTLFDADKNIVAKFEGKGKRRFVYVSGD